MTGIFAMIIVKTLMVVFLYCIRQLQERQKKHRIVSRTPIVLMLPGEGKGKEIMIIWTHVLVGLSLDF